MIDNNSQEYATAKEIVQRLAPSKAEVYEIKGWPEFKNPRATGEQGSQFRNFILAREFVRSLNLKSAAEWREYNRSGKRPADIPAKPDRVYKTHGWVSFPDWMGYKDPGNTSFKPFKEAREFTRSLGLKSENDWREYKKSGSKPDDIPAKPEKVYKNKGWCGFMDWLGYSTIQRNQPSGNSQFKEFKEAKEFARSLGLKSEKDWKEYKKSGAKPDDIPAKPEKVYKNYGWCGFMDWLGYTQVQRKSNSNFLSFEESREFARSLNLKTENDWREYKRTGNKPSNIPAKPENVYKYDGWNGYRDWLNEI